MCRWLGYSGDPILLEDVLFKPKNSLIDQSMSSKSAETPTNADGFGVGWYGNRPTPGLFRSIRPAWNDFNLRDLAAQVASPLFLAHVRATSLATVQETNCHPFRYGKWLFVHNGEVDGIELIRKKQAHIPIKKGKETVSAPRNVINLMDALRRSVQTEGKGAPAPKKGKKRVAGQTEMLLPIAGKGEARAKAKEGRPTRAAEPRKAGKRSA